MTISQPREVLFELSGSTHTSENASKLFHVHPGATKVTLIATFDQAGTLDVDFVDLAGNKSQIGTTATVADAATPLVFDYNPGTIQCRFTPGAQPITGRIEALYSGHAGSSA